MAKRTDETTRPETTDPDRPDRSTRTDLAHVPSPSPLALAAAAARVDLHAAVVAGRNAKTIRAYLGDFRDFARYLGSSDPSKALDALVSLEGGQANAVAIGYRADMVDRGLAAATVARRLAALRSAVKLARTLGRVNWSLEVESPRSESLRDTRGPGDPGWKAVLELAKQDAATGKPIAVRNLAIIRMLHDLGLRRGEVVSIELSGLDLEGATVAVVGKGRTEAARLTLPAPVKAALAAWVAVRGDKPGPLFVRLDRAASGDVGPFNGESVRRLIGDLGRRAGLSRPLRPHGLRHQAITRVLDLSGGDIRAAARFSCHKDLRTLSKYDDNRTDLAGKMADLISEE